MNSNAFTWMAGLWPAIPFQEDNTGLIFGVLAGLCCCVLLLGAAGAGVFFMMRRKKGEPEAKAAPPVAPEMPAPVVSAEPEMSVPYVPADPAMDEPAAEQPAGDAPFYSPFDAGATRVEGEPIDSPPPPPAPPPPPPEPPAPEPPPPPPPEPPKPKRDPNATIVASFRRIEEKGEKWNLDDPEEPSTGEEEQKR